MSRTASVASSRQASSTRPEQDQLPAGRRNTASGQMPNIAGMALSGPTPQLAQRPGFGTIGKEVGARVNFIKLNVAGTRTIISYAAEHRETATSREIRSRTAQRTDSLLLRESDFRYAASNYGDRFLAQEGAGFVKQDRSSYKRVVDFYYVEEPGPRQGDRKLRVSVILTQNGKYPMATFETYTNDPTNSNFPYIDSYIAMFNTLIDRAVSENPHLATYARRTKYFDARANNGRATLGSGLEAYKGYYKSVRDCIDGLFININTSACAMFREGRLDIVMNELGVAGRFIGPVIVSRSTTRVSRRTRPLLALLLPMISQSHLLQTMFLSHALNTAKRQWHSISRRLGQMYSDPTWVPILWTSAIKSTFLPTCARSFLEMHTEASSQVTRIPI